MAARKPIESAMGVLEVLDALKEHATNPIRAAALNRKIAGDDDFTRRALVTLKAAGWAVETERGWLLSVKAGQFSEQFLPVLIEISKRRRVNCPNCNHLFFSDPDDSHRQNPENTPETEDKGLTD